MSREGVLASILRSSKGLFDLHLDMDLREGRSIGAASRVVQAGQARDRFRDCDRWVDYVLDRPSGHFKEKSQDLIAQRDRRIGGAVDGRARRKIGECRAGK